MSLISLGPSSGIMVVNGIATYNTELGKKKFEFTVLNGKIAAGDKKTFDEQLKSLQGFKKTLSCLTCCCCCCPCTNCYTSTTKAKARL